MDADRQVSQMQGQPPPPAALGTSQTQPSTPLQTQTYGLGAQLPKIITTTDAMEQARKGIFETQEQLGKTLPGAQGAVEERRAALQGELEKPMPQAPQLRDIPQFKPREISGQEMTMFAGIAMALAGLGTKAMRGDTAM